jgi:hypothetical protein
MNILKTSITLAILLNIVSAKAQNTFPANGNVGIGNLNPVEKLHISAGNIIIEGNNSSPILFTGIGGEENKYLQLINSPSYSSASGLKAGGILVSDAYNYANPGKNDMIIKGVVGIGTNAPNANAKLDVAGNIFVSNKIAIGTTDMAKIGTYALAVNGDAIFNKARVKLYNTWPDFVFEQQYTLLPIAELEEYIQQYKHLPGVPSAQEVEQQGIDLGSNQATLLQKIEELTLYTISTDKKNTQLQQELKSLQKQVEELKSLLPKK